MSLTHPIERAKVALLAFAFCGITLAFGAEPVEDLDRSIHLAPMAEIEIDLDASPRRAWREQLPAVIIVRRPRAT